MTVILENIFGHRKPIIAMAHIPALPGTPRYDEIGGMQGLIEHTRNDVELLMKGGVDGILFCNEDDRPYMFEAPTEQVAAMTRVVTELRPRTIPFGVDFLWDPLAALFIGAATGANFIREVFTGTYESDMGLWTPDAAQVLQRRRNIHAENITLFYNTSPEFCSALGTRSPAERAKSAVVSSLAEVILISGPMAGVEPDYSVIQDVKQAVGPDIPVLLNTGAKASNIAEYLEVADGVIVGSSLKNDGYTWNPIDPQRVKAFMTAANKVR